MRRIEWVLAIFVIGMGLMCLLVSANSFGEISFSQFGRTMGPYCIAVFIVVGFIALIYYLIMKKRKR
ncbi:hypothetical protein [Paenibacillus segetis]|uniref:DUF3955 domain-containing protein n=1 Tax=Paenibacillus segetis TaxID=1325360 RepID=A0ABQ1YDK7_9BACL|nr:hypothetical protein [Paenibacillus segetis]GGH21807.1 hypothetical protein GCM10008013_19920 [Paenibacillus segetis]